MSIQFGVPQVSVFGPVLFTLYRQPLVRIIERLSLCFHFYADDTHLYEACRIEDLPSLVSSVSDCISGEKILMKNYRLKLNDDKTEFIIIGNNIGKLSQTTININGHNYDS